MPLNPLRRIRDFFTPRRLMITLAVLAVISGVMAAAAPLAYRKLVSVHETYLGAMTDAGVRGLVRAVMTFGITSALSLAIAAYMTTRRKPSSLGTLRWMLVPGYVLVAIYIFTTVKIIDLVLDMGLPVGDTTLDLIKAAWLKWLYNGPALLIGALLAFIHLLTWYPKFAELYGVIDLSASGFEDDRSGVPRIGRQSDPTYRSSVVGSVFAHVVVIIILPWLLQTRGCTALEYALPGGGGGGGGGEVQPQQQAVKIKKAPARRKFIFRTNAAITFRVPKLEDSQVAETVEQMTENEYVANQSDTQGPGGPGKGFGGGGGEGGGWPGGKDGAPIRFIRLQYNGERWEDGMDNASRADVNFLEELRKASGLKVAKQSEAITPSQLRSFKKGALPPFIFMTGEGSINMPEGDLRAVRQYLLDGGMLFADCGSPQWNNSFRDFMRKVLPESPLLDISNDDMIFRTWFHFPNGAPPLWHHGGSRALGAKLDGRWAVFYFPGDMNDAWKTGHNDANPLAVQQAYKLGVNVVKYAVDQYWALTKQPKAK